HGSSDKFLVRKGDGFVELGVNELAAAIKAVGGAGQDIRLISCATGKSDTSIAQALADKLGVKVDAPSDTVWILPDGRTVIGKNPPEATGTWSSYAPKPGKQPVATPAPDAHTTPRPDDANPRHEPAPVAAGNGQRGHVETSDPSRSNH